MSHIDATYYNEIKAVTPRSPTT